MDTIHILKDTQGPTMPAARSDVRASSSAIGVSTRAADEEFEMFAAKKRASKRGAKVAAPATAEPKTKGKRKATDMDTSK